MSTDTTPVTSASITKLDRLRAKHGQYVAGPTKAEIIRRFDFLKSWFSPRDLLVLQFYNMMELKNPYENGTKGGLEDGGYLLPSQTAQYATAPFPFDISTLAISSVATKHPHAACRATSKLHTDKQVLEAEMFMNGLLDTRMEESNFLATGHQHLMSSGWLIASFPYDPALAKQGRLPYDIQLLSPLGVYPWLNSRREIICVFIERRVTGAQLLQDYSFYPGVAELFDAEPDDDTLPEDSPAKAERARDGNSLLTSTFQVVRYYDDAYTCLLVNGVAGGISENAAEFNPELAGMRESKKPRSALASSEGETGDPYHGVLEHKLGRVPLDMVWCWPEARDMTVLDPEALSGRYIGLPYLYGQFHNWRDLSRLLSQLHTTVIRKANPKITTTDENADFKEDVVRLAEGQKAEYMNEPGISPEEMQLLQTIGQEVERGTFGAAAYGTKSGTSGAQQNISLQSGTVRMDTPNTEIERMCEKVCRGIDQIMLARGDEEISVNGKGAKYDGPYSQDYTVGKRKTPVAVSVRLLDNRGFKNPDNAAIYKSLVGTIDKETLLGEVLEVPNPKRMLERLKQEELDIAPPVLGPVVELAALKKQVELEPERRKAEMALEKEKAITQFELDKAAVEQDTALLSEEEILERNKKHLTQLMGQKGIPPDPRLSPAPGPSGPGGLPPGPGAPPGGPGGPPPGGPPPGMPPPGMVGPPPPMPPGPPGPPMMGPPPGMMGPPPPMPNRPMPPRGLSIPPPPHVGPGPMPPGIGPGGPHFPPPNGPPHLGPPQPGRGLMPPPPGPIMRPPPRPGPGPNVPLPSVMAGPPHGPGPGNAIAKAPGQAQQPFQPPARLQPPGGVGRPGLPPNLIGPAGHPGQLSPALQEANANLPHIGPLPAPTLGHSRNGRPRRRRRGKK